MPAAPLEAERNLRKPIQQNFYRSRSRDLTSARPFLAAQMSKSVSGTSISGPATDLDDVKRGLEALAHGRSGHGVLRRLAIAGTLKDSKHVVL